MSVLAYHSDLYQVAIMGVIQSGTHVAVINFGTVFGAWVTQQLSTFVHTGTGTAMSITYRTVEELLRWCVSC